MEAAFDHEEVSLSAYKENKVFCMLMRLAENLPSLHSVALRIHVEIDEGLIDQSTFEEENARVLIPPLGTRFATVRSILNTPDCHSAGCCSRFQKLTRAKCADLHDPLILARLVTDLSWT